MLSFARETAASLSSSEQNKDQSENNKDTAHSNEDQGEVKVTAKLRRETLRPTMAALKASTVRPDNVDQWDANARAPLLLVQIKAARNTVAVPRHWNQKRKYLQNKRGFEKRMFRLPDYIQATGVEKLMMAQNETEDSAKPGHKQMARGAPKLGKFAIDYTVLHDAFFKYQTKPQLTVVGDQYYENKELEPKYANKTPGVLSTALREALGIPVGAPPPWLYAMQRIGPPPSYPRLRIPGLNAPIPANAQWGFHPGGWGKAPVDEAGQPLYQFGEEDRGLAAVAANVDRSRFGEFVDEELEAAAAAPDGALGPSTRGETQTGANATTAAAAGGSASAQVPGLLDESGLVSVSGLGIETPATSLELRKGRAAQPPPVPSAGAHFLPDEGGPKQLYTVVEQKSVAAGQGGIMGVGGHTYAIPPPVHGSGARKPQYQSTEAIAIDPELVEAGDQKALEARYNEALGRHIEGAVSLAPDAVAEEASSRPTRQGGHSNNSNNKRPAPAPEKKDEKKKFKF